MKELSFPQMAPTNDAFFSTGTGLERVRVVRQDLDCWRAGMQTLGLSRLR